MKHRIVHHFDKSLHLISQALAPHILCLRPPKRRMCILILEMKWAIAIQYATRFSLAHRRLEKFFTLQLLQLFSGRLNIHHISIVGFNSAEGLDNVSITLFRDDLKVNRVNSVFGL